MLLIDYFSCIGTDDNPLWSARRRLHLRVPWAMLLFRPGVKGKLKFLPSAPMSWWFKERCIDLISFHCEFLINSHGQREIIKTKLINETGNGQDLCSGSFQSEDPAVLTDRPTRPAAPVLIRSSGKRGLKLETGIRAAPSATWPWLMSYFMKCAEVKV